jgi:hypothetical protein
MRAAASFLVDGGEHPRVIQHRLGHATARLSMELYAHVPRRRTETSPATSTPGSPAVGRVGCNPAPNQPGRENDGGRDVATLRMVTGTI